MNDEALSRHRRMVAVYTKGESDMPEWLPRFLELYEAMMFYFKDKAQGTNRYSRQYCEEMPLIRRIEREVENNFDC